LHELQALPPVPPLQRRPRRDPIRELAGIHRRGREGSAGGALVIHRLFVRVSISKTETSSCRYFLSLLPLLDLLGG
jgi:hypothetical protein